MKIAQSEAISMSYVVVREQAADQVDGWLAADDIVVAALELDIESLHRKKRGQISTAQAS